MSAEQFALIGSAYYLTYAFMQIPVGLLLDRFSVKLLVTSACAFCTLGTLWFSFADGFLGAFIGRLLIGLGSSFGFVGLMIVTLNWFPRRQFAFLVGCGQFFGAIGPLCAGTPIAWMLIAVNGDWRLIFRWVGIVGGILAVLIGIFFKGKPVNTSKVVFVDHVEPLRKRIVALLQSGPIWWILLYSATVYMSLPLIGAFWGTSFLEAKGFAKPAAAGIVSMVWLGLAVGSPLIGKISDLIKRRKPLIMLCGILGLISSTLILYTSIKSGLVLGSLFFLVGLGGSGQNISFAIITEYSPKSLKATALALNNTALMGFAAVVPPIVTYIMKNFTAGGNLTEAAFIKGLTVIPLSFSLALLIAVFAIRETFCRQQNTIHKMQS